MEIDKTKLLKDLTVDEFLRLLSIKEEKKYVYGLKGLARLLGCSRQKASDIKGSGIINDAIIQNGNIILIDKERALELLKNSPKKRQQ